MVGSLDYAGASLHRLERSWAFSRKAPDIDAVRAQHETFRCRSKHALASLGERTARQPARERVTMYFDVFICEGNVVQVTGPWPNVCEPYPEVEGATRTRVLTVKAASRAQAAARAVLGIELRSA